jgi:hypothetical protein
MVYSSVLDGRAEQSPSQQADEDHQDEVRGGSPVEGVRGPSEKEE